MTIAKNFLKELLNITMATNLSSEEKLSKAWDELDKYDYTEEDIDSGSNSVYIYTFPDGSRAKYMSYDEGDGRDISFTPTDEDERTMSEEEYCSLCSNFYEDYGEEDYERVGLAKNEFLDKYPIEQIQLINELAKKHGIQNYLVLTDDDRIYCSELDRYYDEDDLWDLYDIELSEE